MAESSASSAQLEAFGRAIRTALAEKGLTSGALLHLTKATTPAGQRRVVNDWLSGNVEPSRVKVVALEKVLELAPGTLSRHLGWLPVNATELPDLEGAIIADDGLSSMQKQVLLSALSDFRRLNLESGRSEE